MKISTPANRRSGRQVDPAATQPLPLVDPDLDLVHLVTGALASAPGVDPAGVHVSAESGRVTLRGTVPTHSERLAAVTTAATVPGVRGVENLLRVRDLEPATGGYDDLVISTAVRRAIDDSTVRVDGLRLDIAQHVVTVEGRVATQKDKAALRHAIQNARGVHFIDDRIEVAGAPLWPTIEDLDPVECFRLLRQENVGRLAVQDEAGIDVFPVNYVLYDNAIYFRSAPGVKMIRLTEAPRVSFEVDRHGARQTWSVVVRGVARRLDSDEEIAASGIADAPTAHPSEKLNYVRIRPEQITGRRFRTPRR